MKAAAAAEGRTAAQRSQVRLPPMARTQTWVRWAPLVLLVSLFPMHVLNDIV